MLVRESGHRRNWSPLILLGKRNAQCAYYPDVWDVLGGHLEPGEAVEQALVRELREETGVTSTAWRSLGDQLENLALRRMPDLAPKATPPGAYLRQVQEVVGYEA